MTDNHVHFTGSLPTEFLWECIQNKNFGNKELSFSSLNDLEFYIESLFCNEYQNNIKSFFESYQQIKKIIKPKNDLAFEILYFKGTMAIAKSMLKEGINAFNLISGISQNFNMTIDRMNLSLNALSIIEKKYNLKNFGMLRLTIIRDSNRLINNTNQEGLSRLLIKIDKNPNLINRINCFDFSGEENPLDMKNLDLYVEELKRFNKYLKNKQKKPINISIHSGENLFDFKSEDYLIFYEWLLAKEIDIICHGTFLWIPKKFIQITKSELNDRDKLLDSFTKKGVKFEICPSANLILSPLDSFKDVKLNKINFSINTDNKTIFKTNLQKETKLFYCTNE